MHFYSIHTSGHADIQTLKKVTQKLKPKSIIPIHTFNPASYEMLGGNVRKLEDGETFVV